MSRSDVFGASSVLKEVGLDYLGDIVAGSGYQSVKEKDTVCYYLPAKDFRRLLELERHHFAKV